MAGGQRYWITDPAGHRRVIQEEARNGPKMMEFFGQKVEVIYGSLQTDEWVCDNCNDPIPIAEPDGTPIWVPCLDSRALCPRCMTKQLTDDEKALLEAGDTIVFWAMQAHGCDPCRKAVEQRFNRYVER